MNKAKPERILTAFKLMMNGSSARAVKRMTGLATPTLKYYLWRSAVAALRYQDDLFEKLPLRQVQCDEMYTYLYGHRRNVSEETLDRHVGVGDIWTWTAIDTDTKLFVNWLIGGRTLSAGTKFFQAMKRQVEPTTEIVSDGFHVYIEAIDQSFLEANHRVVVGGYDMRSLKTGAHTNHAERFNTTLRQSISRYRRRSGEQSKSIWWHVSHLALFSMYYNFCRVHGTLRVTPAMEAGLADHVWALHDLLALGEDPWINDVVIEDVLSTRVCLASLGKSQYKRGGRWVDHHRDNPLRMSRGWPAA